VQFVECEQIRVHMNRSHVQCTCELILAECEFWSVHSSTQSAHVQCTWELRENESSYSLDQFTRELIYVKWSIMCWISSHVKCTC